MINSEDDSQLVTTHVRKEETAMHAIEKLLAEKAGKASVHAGEIVNCDVDIAGINDLYYQTVKSFYEMGGEKVFDPEKVYKK